MSLSIHTRINPNEEQQRDNEVFAEAVMDPSRFARHGTDHEGSLVLLVAVEAGAKLCMIADLLGGVGSVTGVDVSRDRLATCRTLACKYRIPNCRLFLCDGTTFSAPPPSTAAAECVARAAGLRLTRVGSVSLVLRRVEPG